MSLLKAHPGQMFRLRCGPGGTLCGRPIAPGPPWPPKPMVGATGMVEARAQFRRVNGHPHLRALRAALERHVAAENVGRSGNNDTVTAA